MDIQYTNRALRAKKLADFLCICRDFGQWDAPEELDALEHRLHQVEAFEADIQMHHPEEDFSWRPGQAILLCGAIGMAGTDFLGRYRAGELCTRLPERFVRESLDAAEQISRYPSVEQLKSLGVTAVYPVGEGGLYRPLFRLGKDSGLGFRIAYSEVPVRQETIEFCEFYDLDPWQLFSCGCVLLVADRGSVVRRALESVGMPCHTLGYLEKGKDKLICHSEIESRVNRPQPDALLTVLKQGLEEPR